MKKHGITLMKQKQTKAEKMHHKQKNKVNYNA